MKLSKQQIVLGAVLGLGVAALAVDKLFLGASSPSPAAAATSPSKATSAGAADAQLVEAPAPNAATAGPAPIPPKSGPPATLVPLSDRFSTLAPILAGAESLSDPFQAPEAWKPRVAATDPAPPQAVSMPSETTPAFKLSLVMRPIDPGAGRTIAVINGKPYAQGAVIDGYTLVEITAESAVLRRGERTVELNIPRLNDATGQSAR